MRALSHAIAHALPVLPRRLVHVVAKKYVAGSNLEDALRCVRELNAAGASATVDVLGEFITHLGDADRTRDEYVRLMKALAERRLDANVSVKLTALGLKIDAERCLANVATLCEEARALGSFVRLDMEDSSCTEDTLRLYERLRERYDNVGPVLQAYLRRTIHDARRVSARQPANVRLCKGIYVETRDIAWKDREIVRRNYAWVLRELLAAGCKVGIATHDELLAWEALRAVDELRIPKERYEFQMLLGVDTELRDILIRAGHPLRVYVPYGTHWYEYSLRRLKENPEVAGHVLRATLGLRPG